MKLVKLTLPGGEIVFGRFRNRPKENPAKCKRCETMAHSPGKFEGETLLAKDLYESAMEGGANDELGDAETFGYYWKFSADGKLLGKTHEGKKVYNLIDGHRHPVYAILSTESQGFVTVNVYPSKAKLDEVWERLEADYEKFLL